MRRGMAVRTVASVAALVGTLVAVEWAPVGAAQGNWSQGCAPGWACHWKTAVGSGVATSTTVDDSSFVGDTHWDGSQLGDFVKYIQNRTTSSWVSPYKDPNYFLPLTAVPPGASSGAYPVSPSNGVSAVCVGACSP